MNSFEENIESLEIRITYLEDHIQQISKVMMDQQSQIETLIRKNKSQESKIREISEMLDEMPHEEKPPHY